MNNLSILQFIVFQKTKALPDFKKNSGYEETLGGG